MSTPPVQTDRDAAGAFELLATASGEPSVIAVLTDEELLALHGTEAPQLTGSPFLDDTDIEAEKAAAIALRSLIARGLVVVGEDGRENEGDAAGTGEATGQRLVQADRTLSGLLALRTSPLAMVNLTRQVADQATSMMLYLFPRGGVLEEFVTADGYHHFSIPTREVLADRMQQYVDQASVAGSTDADPIESTVEELESDSEIGRRLADTRALTVLTSVDRSEHTQLSLMVTSDAVFVMDTPTEENQRTAIREVSEGTLRRLLDDALPTVD